MTDPQPTPSSQGANLEARHQEADRLPSAGFFARGGVAGALMGLANLVPGISGGTMLLAAGVYPDFIGAIAELSRFRIRLRPIAVVGTIAGTAALVILVLAGTMKSLVVEQRWLMYSLFIGLSLGGVPLVWRLARPATPGVWLGAAAAFTLMVVMAFGGEGAADGSDSVFLLMLSGVAGASAMILPGVSGGYLLLLLGQYETILGAVDLVKQGLAARNLSLLLDAASVVVPVGLGVLIGVVGVSNLLHWLLKSYAKPTLGVLLGLLFGAVVGLWPFQQPVAPEAGDVIKGRTVTAERVAEIDVDEWRLERFAPSGFQAAASLALIGLGLAGTLAVARLGSSNPPESETGIGPGATGESGR